MERTEREKLYWSEEIKRYVSIPERETELHDMVFAIDGVDGEFSGEAMSRENDGELDEMLAGMEIGQSQTFGGGAFAEFVIRRIQVRS